MNLKSIRTNSIPFSFEILIPLNVDIDTFYADFVYLFKIEIYTNEFFTFTRLKLWFSFYWKLDNWFNRQELLELSIYIIEIHLNAESFMNLFRK